MNKSTKIRLNYLIGIAIAAVLLWSIGVQIYQQVTSTDGKIWRQTGPAAYGICAMLLLFLNLGIETKKWQLLVMHTQQITYRQSLKSVLCGIALSLVTPNRIGEYPARILALKQKKNIRLVSVSLLGIFSQLLALLLFGLSGLVFYNRAFPSYWTKAGLLCSVVAIALLLLLYIKHEWWSERITKIKWLKKFSFYTGLVKQFSTRDQLTIIVLSALKFVVYTSQYVLMLRWMNVHVPFLEGFCLASLFFWAVTIIPTIAFAEVGIRAQIGLMLFGKYSGNVLGIVGATVGLWALNLVIPAIVGSILLSRARLL